VPTDAAANDRSPARRPTAPAADSATSDPAEADPVTPPDPPIVAVWQEDGPATQQAQEFLMSLGFWLEEANGEYGQTTTQAVMAFQKYYGLIADGKLGPQTAEAMNAVTERPSGRSTGGTLIEVDKSKQLLFVVRDGATEWVLNTSTGSEVRYRVPDQNTPGEFIEDDSITRPGVFAVDRERPEGWWEGDLGEIYRPKYFDGGIAIHGAYSIPPYPASHGCVRLSVQAMDWIWDDDVVPMGSTVWVHGEIPDRDA
jgi:lipoprotein-anchoring transpeptidase ErfK/SrfK